MIRCARYALAVLLVALAGCSAPEPAPEPAPTAPTVAPAPVLSAKEVAFVAQVRRIAPGVPGSDERIATRGRSTCDSIRDGRPLPQAVGQARERFGPDAVSTVQAGQIVEAARSTVCAG